MPGRRLVCVVAVGVFSSSNGDLIYVDDDVCPAPPSSDCCIANGTTGCEDADCQIIVCSTQPLCCDNEWDFECADLATILCGDLCTPNLGGGSGTEDDPYCSIQNAINNAVDTDEIIVAPGTYFETIDLDGKAVWLHSSDGPEMTVIDGTGHDHVVQCVHGEGPDTVIEGMTITGGNADGLFPDSFGGGMLNDNSCPTVTNCIFTGNSASFGGGGMYNFSSSSPLVDYCTFDGNTAISDGGGMANFASSPTVTHCTFIGNAAGDAGGAMHNSQSSPPVSNCTFSGNSAGFAGGGIANVSSSPAVTDCVLAGNSAGDRGGAMNNVSGSSPTVVNCTFDANSATSGGALRNSDSSPAVTNCTFSGNIAELHGGGMHNVLDSSPAITNCVLWGDRPNELDGFLDTTTVTYSNVQNGRPGIGNLEAEPMFIDPGNGDLRLQPGSPCIDAGNNWAVAGLVETDLDGNPRFAGDGNDFDPGCGEPVVVDMGAYEFPGTPFDVVFGDLNGNGTVGVFDLAILNECLGSDDPDCCIADLNIDGNVGMIDLMLMGGAMVEFVPVTAVP